MSIKIATQQEVLSLMQKLYGQGVRKHKIYSFYSSEFKSIIVDENLMVIPVDDRMATRAHGVFDVIYVKKLNLINLESHVSRLFRSSESVSIVPPMTEKETFETIVEVTKQTLRNLLGKGLKYEELKEKVFGVRISISSGYGDFGIASLNKKPVFYLNIFDPYINYEVEKEGVNEFIVKTVKGDKINDLVHSKTVNYVDNALMANKSKQLGGYQGIKAYENGVLLEAAAANIAFIFGKEFASPRLETVMKGTTLKKLLKYIEQLKEQGIIEKISFRDITIEEAENTATEMMVLGGDKIVPVLNFNGKQISKKKGKFVQMFQEWYEKQNEVALPLNILQEL